MFEKKKKSFRARINASEEMTKNEFYDNFWCFKIEAPMRCRDQQDPLYAFEVQSECMSKSEGDCASGQIAVYRR